MAKFKTGVVLSGGAMRGVAHLGVLKALEEIGTRIDVISGTSIGAIIGAFYASGYKAEEIFQLYKDKNPFKYLRPRIPVNGFLSTDKLFNDFKTYLEGATFEDLKISLYVTTTNLTTGKQACFSNGSLFPIIKAASAVPIIFNPEKIEGELHVDGGLLSNMPVEPLIGQCQYLIGVNVNPIGVHHELNSINSILMRTLHLSIWGNTNKNIAKVDLYIEPEKLKEFSLVDHNHLDDIFQVGYVSGIQSLKKNRVLEI